jgi:hypothetical protein
MKRHLPLAASALLLVACSETPTAVPTPELSSSLGAAAQVTTSEDAGPGSLRAAIEAANSDPTIRHIQVARGLGGLELETPLEYQGEQALVIHGANLVIDGAALGTDEPAFLADGGADLTLTRLTIQNAPGCGLLVEVPTDANAGSLQALTLEQVTIKGNGLHGVLLNDQTTEGDGSDAGLLVRVAGSTFEDNGNGALDYDGLRLNEGGRGGIEVTVLGSRFEGNGADGIEFDERGPGSVVFTVQETEITGNGFYDQTEVDPDDGIDVDEWGEGDIIGRMVRVSANDNAEEGIDLNENEAGNLRIEMHQVEASGNPEEGIDLEEDDDVIGGGDLIADLTGVTANRNGTTSGDGGVKLRERGNGGIVTRMVNVVANQNAENGIQIREQDGGAIDGRIQAATTANNLLEGIRLRGNGAVRVLNLTASGNGGGGDIRSEAGITLVRKP